MAPDLNDLKYLRYSICVSGAAAGITVQKDKEVAREMGRAIAKTGHILTTGATVGLPYFAALGAKEEGGTSIGFSPATSLREHVRKYRLPYDVFDFINFTGMNYVGRDLYLVQSSDAVITVGGRFGSLHEFTSALEAHMPCGVLIGSGGAADLIPELMRILPPPHNDLVIYDSDPDRLVQKIVKILDGEYKDIRDELSRHDHHWFLRETASNPPPRAG
ncbi:MAG TPA: hypothetical protein VL737_03750 [Candidatus Pristimantibacillus sp.]|jgi:uncharacterized protein (TIGR00725 family)|nr:hypothetical protein [Candidatus Pristimantibacillus sp.]